MMVIQRACVDDDGDAKWAGPDGYLRFRAVLIPREQTGIGVRRSTKIRRTRPAQPVSTKLRAETQGGGDTGVHGQCDLHRSGARRVQNGAVRRTGQGPYGAFIKLAREFDAGLHIHSSDVRIVVIRGFYLRQVDAGEKRLGTEGFMEIPAGTQYRSGGDQKWGVIFYVASDGRFDLMQEAVR